MELEVRNAQGEVAGTAEVSDYLWAEPMREALLHQVIVAQRANRRQGTHDTKTRSDVIASGRKLRPQKHTGRARIGSRGSPHLRGGGQAHGPHPRSYRQRISTRIRRTALRVALSEQQRRGRVVILDELKLDTPSTRVIREAVENLGLADGALIVTADTDRVVLKSAGNLPKIEVLAARLLNPLDAFRARNLLVTQDALGKMDELWGEPYKRPTRKPAAA